VKIEPVAAAAVLAFLTVKCAVLTVNRSAFPTLHRQTGTALAPRVSLLLPARDEEANLCLTLPGFLAQPVAEILVLDDGSRDETAAVVKEFAADDPRVRLITGDSLPRGWVGKAWACHQLGQAATGDVLIFCDADVLLGRGALAAVMAEFQRQRADVFSVFPQQRTVGFGERFLVPLIDDVLLCFLPHQLLELPIPAAATANGQLIAFRRPAYERVGGHRGVRRAVVEDVRLAWRARRAGMRLGLALGGELVGARMYDGYAASVTGFGKSLRAAHGGSRALLAATAGWHVIAYTVPWLRVHGRLRTAWAVAAALGLAERGVVNAKTGRGDWWECALVPVTPLAALPAYALAVRRTRLWKGRRYR
jgi:glycosyltransferase involved in cell wall biosynthesis